MTVELFANTPSTTVTSGGTDAPASGTQETWTVSSSAEFPAASSAATPPSQFHVGDPAAPAEIIAVTNVSGDTWTVTRGAESTTPLQHLADFTVWQVVTAAGLVQGSLLINQGAIAASTAYSPGDMVSYLGGQRVLITTAVTSSAWSSWFTPPTLTAGTYIPITSSALYYATDWGVVPDGVTDNGPALNRALQFMYQGNNSGGFLILPDGYENSGNVCGVSSTVIIPPGCFIVGSGIETSCIRLNANANCDVVQFQTYNSSSQAAIISAATGAAVSAGSLRNAFYSGLMHLTVHGNKASQGASQYNYGVNMTTNPLLTTASSDPDFDPSNLLLNVEFRNCTGDGFLHAGRGQLRVTNCISRYNDGNGFTPSFDSLYVGNNSGENGLGGFYFNHMACDGSATKCFNNGQNPQWSSGSNYSAKQAVMYGGVMYRAINALTDDTTPPSSDPTNWAQLQGGAAQPQWGTGFYWDSNASENAWTGCDAQENAASDYYLHDCLAITVQGVSNHPNFGGVSNPDYYSSLVLDGAAGCIADLGFSTLNSLAYALRVVNSAVRNDVRMAGGTSYEAILSPDSITLIGSGNSVRVNGTSLTTPIDATASDIQPDGTQGAGATAQLADAGHIHPSLLAGWIPADDSLLLANYDPLLGTSNSAMTAGVAVLVQLHIRQAMTISNIVWRVFTGATGSSTGTYSGLYSSSGALLSGSSDAGTLLQGTGIIPVPLTTPQALTAGTWVWAALLPNFASTQPTLIRAGAISQANLGLTAATYRFASAAGTGLSSLPSPITPANNVTTNAFSFWVGGK